ncbi:MAG: iron-sulfur cluster repair di-iron protein [Alphaproteobacteria bacterium]|nr:iron-sulfur cluster repair di-iron protein [Alphaproteobacteria bacterium]
MLTPSQLVRQDPRAARVLHRHNIEFCCEGGNETLETACDRRGLDVEDVLAEIEGQRMPEQPDWSEAPLGDLVQHILATHHRPLDEELPRLQHLAATVRGAHPDHAVWLGKVQLTLDSIVQELLQHMPKEENVLFPLILAGRGHVATMPMEVMETEHRRLGELLSALREVTDGFQAPADACPTWQALWTGLDALTEDLHVHVHLEDHILFPRARVAPSARV